MPTASNDRRKRESLNNRGDRAGGVLVLTAPGFNAWCDYACLSQPQFWGSRQLRHPVSLRQGPTGHSRAGLRAHRRRYFLMGVMSRIEGTAEPGSWWTRAVVGRQAGGYTEHLFSATGNSNVADSGGRDWRKTGGAGVGEGRQQPAAAVSEKGTTSASSRTYVRTARGSCR